MKSLIILLLCAAIACADKVSATGEQQLLIRLCCNPSEFLNTSSYRCEKLSIEFNVTSWIIANFHSNDETKTVNRSNVYINYSVGRACEKPFAYKFFDYHNDPEYCYTPLYHPQKMKYIIMTLDCDFIAQMYIFIFDTYLIGIGISTIFLVVTVTVCKELQVLGDVMPWRFSLYHLISWSCAHVLVIVCACLTFVELVPVLWCCFTSSRLWLNVIGIEKWLKFVDSFKAHGSTDGTKQFQLYAIYVWGVSLLSAVLTWLLGDSKPMDTKASFAPTIVVITAAILAFGQLLYKMFSLRRSVLNTTKGKHFIRKCIPVVLYLVYFLILPWIIFVVWLLNLKNIYAVGILYASLVAEGPVLFAIIVPMRKLGYLCDNNLHSQKYDAQKSGALMEEAQT